MAHHSAGHWSWTCNQINQKGFSGWGGGISSNLRLRLKANTTKSRLMPLTIKGFPQHIKYVASIASVQFLYKSFHYEFTQVQTIDFKSLSTAVPDVIFPVSPCFIPRFFWSSLFILCILFQSWKKANDYPGNCIVVFALKPCWCYLVSPMRKVEWISQNAPELRSSSHPYPFRAVWV